MIEKVRSIAMSFGPQIYGNFGLRRLYRRTTAPASDLTGGLNVRKYSNFTMMKVVCNGHTGAVHEHSHKAAIDRLPARQMMELTMFRKLLLAAVAAIACGAALAPTSAAAWYGGYRHGWWGPRFYVGAPVSYGYGGCYVRQLVATPWGPRWRLVNRCY
jgi:hypothetical protein